MEATTRLVIGLGNIGKRYEHTRHNFGFMVLDQLAANNKFIPSLKFDAEIYSYPVKGKEVLLAKPTTMMNLSGVSVAKLMRFYKLQPAEVLVVHDELDLEFGVIKNKVGGGSAGHKA